MKHYLTVIIMLAGFYSYGQVDTLKNDGIVKLIKKRHIERDNHQKNKDITTRAI